MFNECVMGENTKERCENGYEQGSYEGIRKGI